MPRDLTKGHAALRRGRVSIPGAEYFLTVCTDEHRSGLTTPLVAQSILSELNAMSGDGTWQLRCGLVMPDHVHLLVILGSRLPPGKAVARLKAKTSAAVRSVPMLGWERDFFDRHIRPDDDRLTLFLYTFHNPYRAGLCMRGARWPWYCCGEEDWTWFSPMLDEGRPIPEWLA